MQALFGQLLIGLINGAFYAMLSLGLAVIFGLLNIINFTHGAQYMMGAFCRVVPAEQGAAVGYWWALLLAPIVVGAIGVADRAHDAGAAVQARSPVRIAAHVRPGAGHPGPVPQRVRLVGAAVPDPVAACRRRQSRLHVPADLPRLGDRRVAGRVLFDLVRDRAHQARQLSARGDRESRAGAGVRHQRAAHDHADVRLRRRTRGAGRRDGGADLPGQSADGRRPDHRRVRRRRDRRHGLDHGSDPHRLRPRRRRRADQVLLSRRRRTR